MPAYSTDDLVSAVRRLAYLPDASDITAVEILARADEEMATLIADAVKAGREGFWLAQETTALVSSQTAYQIPRRALGRGVVGVQMVNAQGTAFTIPQIDPVIGWNGRTVTINSYCYSFQADRIVFPTPPPDGYSLRVWYLRRPSKLVATTDGAPIIKAASSTTLSLVSAPTWLVAFNPPDTTPVPMYVDLVRGDAGFDQSYVDELLTGYAALVATISPAVDVTQFVDITTIQNDRSDYLCRRDETVYPTLPIELHPVLEAAVAKRIAISLKDMETAGALEVTLQERKRAALDIIEPRNEEGSRPIVRNRSPLRQTFGIGRRWR